MATIWTQHDYRIAQATGMVSVQADCSLDAALELLQHRAVEHGWSVDEVAAAVVDRRIRFAPETA